MTSGLITRFRSLALVTSLLCASAAAAQEPARMSARIIGIERYTTKEAARVDSAVSLAVQVVNLPAFRAAVLAYGGGDARRSFVERDGRPLAMSNAEVLAAFGQAAEEFAPEQDREMDLHLIGKNRFLGWPFGWPGYPVGYVDSAKDPYIYSYRTWVRDNGVADVAGHVVHEWTHKLGFVHDYADTRTRPCSVPYALGNLVVFFATQLRAAPGSAVRAPDPAKQGEEGLVACEVPHPPA